MSTIRATVLPAKVLKDGRHKIRIAICHKQDTAYIPTDIVIDSLSEFKNGQVVKRPDASYLNTRLRRKLDECQQKLDGINNQDLYNASQLRNLIVVCNREGTGISIEGICKEVCEGLRKESRESYARLLEYASKNFVSYIGENFPLSGVTPAMIKSFRVWLGENTRMSDVIKDATLSRIRILINKAVKRHYISYKIHPFSEISLHTEKIRDVSVSVETMHKVMNYETDSYKKMFGRDMFLLSFFMGGMNFADILRVDFSKDVVSFVRHKTRNMGTNYTTTFSICPYAKEIALKYIDKKGYIKSKYHFATYESLVAYLGDAVKKMKNDIGIEENLVFYSARDTFAQFAFELGVPDAIVDYIIAHSPRNRGMIAHYSKVKQKQADMVLAKVFDYLYNPDKYRDYIEMRADIMLTRG